MINQMFRSVRMRALFVAMVTVCLTGTLFAQHADPKRPKKEKTVNWPSFRGPGAGGVAHGCNPPTKFSVKKNKNILWKTAIPGLGHSSPIIWGDKVFVTTAISGDKDAKLKVGLYGDIKPVEDDSEHEWRVLCIDRNSGEVLWNTLAHKGVPKIKRHTKATHANSTPATDGEHVVAFFGSEGLYCFGTDGKLIWKKDLGVLDSGYYAVPDAQWEFGSSPVIYDGRVIVQCDVQKDGFLAAFDVKTGKEIWRTPREDVPTWSTPTPHKVGKKTLIFVNGWKHVGAYDFETGKEIWRMKGGGDIPVPTPVVSKDLVYIANAHGQWGPIFAVKTASEGDISLALENGEKSNEHVAWCDPKSYAYMQTPVVLNGLVYNCRDNGGLTCYRAKSGEQVFQQRIGGGTTGFTASAVATDDSAEGHIYYTSEEGDVFVYTTGESPTLVGKNHLNEVCMATPAISGDTIFFRTQGHLIAVAPTKKS